ncbi:hypothetical protein RJ641_025619 [Dillenia turbinata]|uniref:Uncharacterized protein n=1 Tax=Dillenia turbinata TaxID=194707 RepID=A0AAN8WEM5_9MAGN
MFNFNCIRAMRLLQILYRGSSQEHLRKSTCKFLSFFLSVLVLNFVSGNVATEVVLFGGGDSGIGIQPVPFQSLGGTVDENGAEQPQGQREESDDRRTTAFSALRSLFSNSLKGFFHPNHVLILPLKFPIRFVGENMKAKDPCVLSNESQRDVKLIKWRPNGGKVLSVACKWNICIWAASYPDDAAAVRSGIVSFWGTLSRGSGVRWTLVDFLRTQNGEQVSASLGAVMEDILTYFVQHLIEEFSIFLFFILVDLCKHKQESEAGHIHQ